MTRLQTLGVGFALGIVAVLASQAFRPVSEDELAAARDEARGEAEAEAGAISADSARVLQAAYDALRDAADDSTAVWAQRTAEAAQRAQRATVRAERASAALIITLDSAQAVTFAEVMAEVDTIIAAVTTRAETAETERDAALGRERILFAEARRWEESAGRWENAYHSTVAANVSLHRALNKQKRQSWFVTGVATAALAKVAYDFFGGGS
jgi:hypothetical protein